MIVAPVHELVSAVSQVATGTLAAAIWQGILLAGAAAIGLRLLPTTPPAARFVIWFAVFVLVAGLPFATVVLGHTASSAGPSAPSHAWLTVDERWCLWIAGIWATASLVRAVTLVAAALRVRALWKRARVIDATVPSAELARNAKVCVSDEVDRPTVIGFFAPKIVIPEWLIAKLTPAELEQVVLHEASHLSRADDWLNLLQKIMLVVFPLNPSLAWVERRLCFERELACDERVLRVTGAPKAYAECLATLAEYRLERQGLVRGLALALGALGRESELGQRVLRILSGGRRMKPGYARLVLGGATLSLVFAATALERTPQLVGFSHAEPLGKNTINAAPETEGFRDVAVRANVAPPQEWKTVGDAAPHVAKKAARRVEGARESAPRQITALAQADAAPQAVEASTPRMAPMTDGVRMIQTVATMRQVTPEGDVVVTRWMAVTTSSEDTNGQVLRNAAPSQSAQQVKPYAAVPVQGGWLIFQL
jgi:beta-lactamase regulating signal transducer with metallopeptidase domain